MISSEVEEDSSENLRSSDELHASDKAVQEKKEVARQHIEPWSTIWTI